MAANNTKGDGKEKAPETPEATVSMLVVTNISNAKLDIHDTDQTNNFVTTTQLLPGDTCEIPDNQNNRDTLVWYQQANRISVTNKS